MADVMRYAKPEGFQGRGKGHRNYKKLRWQVQMYEDGEFKNGKFSSIGELNEKWNLNLTSCIVQRLMTHKRVDENKSRINSFLKHYQHIQIQKIDELR